MRVASALLSLAAVSSVALLNQSCKNRGCTADTECDFGEICQKQSLKPGTCVAGCREDSDCNTGYACSNNDCLPLSSLRLDATVREDLGVSEPADSGLIDSGRVDSGQVDSGVAGFPDAVAAPDATSGPNDAGQGSGFFLVSDQIVEGGTFPDNHTCAGADLQPSLRWGNEPPMIGHFSLALIDESADLVHWYVDNIPLNVHSLSLDASGAMTLPVGATEAPETWCGTRTPQSGPQYCGPCPPIAAEHSYVFRVYAISPAGFVVTPMTSASAFEQSLQGLRREVGRASLRARATGR